MPVASNQSQAGELIRGRDHPLCQAIAALKPLTVFRLPDFMELQNYGAHTGREVWLPLTSPKLSTTQYSVAMSGSDRKDPLFTTIADFIYRWDVNPIRSYYNMLGKGQWKGTPSQERFARRAFVEDTLNRLHARSTNLYLSAAIDINNDGVAERVVMAPGNNTAFYPPVIMKRGTGEVDIEGTRRMLRPGIDSTSYQYRLGTDKAFLIDGNPYPLSDAFGIKFSFLQFRNKNYLFYTWNHGGEYRDSPWPSRPLGLTENAHVYLSEGARTTEICAFR
jgi:hypothetical protein